MIFLSVFMDICVCAVGAGNISVELYHPQIPWFRSSEYVLRNDSAEVKNCPEWKNLYADMETIERPIMGVKEEGCIKKFLLDPIKAGKYLIPPAVVKEEEGKEWKTSSFILDVRDPTEKEKEEIQNIAGIIEPEVRRSYTNFIIASIVVAAVFVSIVGLFYLLKKYFVKGKTIVEKVELPWEKAFRRLRELKSKDLPSQGLYEPYYVQLTWILRYYIEDRFDIHAPEQTTQEFVDTTMKKKILTDEQQKLLYSFLSHCDKVKFAQFVPTIEQMDAGYNLVCNFVEETQSKEQIQKNREEVKQQEYSVQ